MTQQFDSQGQPVPETQVQQQQPVAPTEGVPEGMTAPIESVPSVQTSEGHPDGVTVEEQPA